jgi:hypothetical protein
MVHMWGASEAYIHSTGIRLEDPWNRSDSMTEILFIFIFHLPSLSFFKCIGIHGTRSSSVGPFPPFIEPFLQTALISSCNSSLQSLSLTVEKKKTSCVYPLLGTLRNPPSYVTTRVWMKAKAWAPLKKKSQSLYVFTISLSLCVCVCVSIVSFSFAAVLIFLRPCISPVTYLDLDVGGQSRVPHV